MSKLLNEMLGNLQVQIQETSQKIVELQGMDDIDFVEKKQQLQAYASQKDVFGKKLMVCAVVGEVLEKYAPMVQEFLPVIEEVISENRQVVTSLLGVLMDSFCDSVDDLKEQRLRIKKLEAENLRDRFKALKVVKFTDDQALAILLAKIPSSNFLQNFGKGVGDAIQKNTNSHSKKN